MKKKLLISFSGGETSAYMAQWLWNNKRNDYHMLFVFANTGEENEATLEFVERCSKHFGFPVVWVEAVPRVKWKGRILEMCKEVFTLDWVGARLGTTYRKVNFKTASRHGEPFEKVIQKYGIPNMAAPFCTRELKQRPINAYARAYGWRDYYTAIGIRSDEIDRVNEKHEEYMLIYPLVDERPMTKPKINFWWNQMPFRLELEGWEGNCKWCWKKWFHKLYQIAKVHPERFDFPKRMESLYSEYVPKSIIATAKNKGKEPMKPPVRFFRDNKTVADIFKEADEWDGLVQDDAQKYEDSCEVFTEC